METDWVGLIVLAIIFCLAVIVSVLNNPRPKKHNRRIVKRLLFAINYYKKTFELLLKEAEELKNRK